MKKLVVFVLSLLLFSGCSIKKDIEQSQSVKVVFKSKDIRVLDVGFLNYAKDYEHLQVLSLSQVVFDIEVKDERVCINSNCFAPKYFNQKILSPFYEDSFIKNILRFLPIKKGQNLKYTDDGFEQIIKQENIDIIYKVDKKSLYFKDNLENILIRINLL